jgi:hypothetical protein
MRSPAPRDWRLVSRVECHLCEEMAEVLEAGLGPRGLAWIEVDVDSDPELRARYGDTVPVLLRDGRAVAKVRLDERTLKRLVAGARVAER